MNNLKKILLYAWQLPQNLLGLAVRGYYIRVSGTHSKLTCNGADVLMAREMRGSVSLGRYIIVSDHASGKTLAHELGHCRQSLALGWLYLPVIGLPSLLWAWAHSSLRCLETVSYHRFFTERWADRLGKTVFGSEAGQTPFV